MWHLRAEQIRPNGGHGSKRKTNLPDGLRRSRRAASLDLVTKVKVMARAGSRGKQFECEIIQPPQAAPWPRLSIMPSRPVE
jgi:hypothetical protein